MSDHNPKAMNKEELEKYIEKDFLPGLLSSLPNVPDLTGENARLKAEVERLDALCKQLMAQHSDISCENIRLRKAGDAVCESPYLWENDPAVIAWRAAKEGKGKP